MLVALLLLSACAGSQKANEAFTDDLRSFQEGLRWRRYEQAAEFVSPDQREDFLDGRDVADKDLRIDDYEIDRVKLAADHETAVVQIKFTWHQDSVGTVHETVVEEKWEKHGKSWRIAAVTHKRGEDMPDVLAGPASRPTTRPAAAP